MFYILQGREVVEVTVEVWAPWFETQERFLWRTYDEAEAGHRRIVNALQCGIRPDALD